MAGRVRVTGTRCPQSNLGIATRYARLIPRHGPIRLA